MSSPFHLRLPATSANLGPGFDALGLALELFLTIEAIESDVAKIDATGRNASQTADLENNLILDTYLELAPNAPPLHLGIHNEIPLGMGLGSSAAALLAGVHLANHFGALGLTPKEILEEACIREGHPDNVAACHLGGLTISSMVGRDVTTATIAAPISWRILLALPSVSLSTVKARALLPDSYSRADAVLNIQSTALLVAAFSQDRPDLLTVATRDRIHQPYRAAACALLPALLPLAGTPGVYAVTLSGAGPSVLLFTDPTFSFGDIMRVMRTSVAGADLEVIQTQVFAPYPEQNRSSR